LSQAPRHDLFDAVGQTPLVRLATLSRSIGREVLAKAEYLNPGGSVKDRAAKFIIEEAERDGRLRPGGTIVESSAGNTGIALAMLAASRGYKTIIVLPGDQSPEKIELLRLFGADVRFAPDVPFADERHFYHEGVRIARETPGAIYADQFNNLANFRSHLATTGPEIWEQCGGTIDAFVCACGTGGTLAGISTALKERKPDVRVVLADPFGSSLLSYVRDGTLDASGDSLVEGIGIKRITENFKRARCDDAVRVDDRSAVEMARYLLRSEGLFVGGSAALNVVAAARVAMSMPAGSTIVTLLCDGGARYVSRLFDAAWLAAHDLTPKADALEFL